MAIARPGDGIQGAILGPLKTRAFGLLRRGDRDVMWTIPGLGLGNFLYQWLWAHAGQQQGLDRRVLEQPEMREWYDVFPGVRERLIVPRAQVRLTDRRTAGSYSTFGDNSPGEIDAFARDLLLSAPVFADALPAPEASTEVVLHIRRGSYYTDPSLRRYYGMDVPGYLRVALEGSTRQDGQIERLTVLSNDQAWCRDQLGWLGEFAGTVRHGDPSASAAEDFRDLALARRSVLGNSTFAYWAGYLSNVIHGDNHAQVWAPLFHIRETKWQAVQLDPRWSIVADIPGGWEEKA